MKHKMLILDILTITAIVAATLVAAAGVWYCL